MSLQIQVARLATPRQTLITGLDVEVPPGEVLTVMGPSGCGKSSLLAAVAGTLPPGLHFEGRVRLDGHDITAWPPARRGVGLLFQDDLLFAHMSVAENLLFAVPPAAAAERRAQVAAALDEAGLAGLGDRDPASLSGGQRSRVALMRALLARPRALLLDEPFSRLDTGLRAQFRRFVFDHIRQRGIPALLVTHDEADVADPTRRLQLATD